MFSMRVDGDRAPIVDEIETEYGEAVNTTVVNRSTDPTSTSEVSSDIRSTFIPWTFMRSCAHTLLYGLLGGSTFVTLWFGLKSPSEINIFQLHIVFCVIGYHLLMPYAVTCVQRDSWTSALSHTHRRRVHWVLQLIGSILAFVGSVIMMAQKTVNFNTLHGKFALSALLFTTASLANGVSSLYSSQLRRYMPPRVSILAHSLIGTLAFLLSSVCLIYGYLKHSFTEWATVEFAYVLVAVTCVNTFLICWPPTYKILRQVFEVVKNKIFL